GGRAPARGARRRDRARGPRHAGVSRPVRQERDREVGRADQGQRRDGGLTGRERRHADPIDGAPHSSSISPLISCEKAIPPSVTVALAGNFSLPLSLPSATAWRPPFSISRWPPPPSFLRNLRFLPLNPFSFMIPSAALLSACFLTIVPVPFFMRADRIFARRCRSSRPTRMPP